LKLDEPMMSPQSDMLVSVFARTDTGLRRPANEDAFMVADLTTGNAGLGPNVVTHRVGERGSLMAVSDGMGGAAAGEVASEIAVKTIHEALSSMPLDMSICEQLRQAVEMANQEVWRYAQDNTGFAGMGATMTAVLVRSASAYVAQVGDSRAYLARGDRIKQVTKDQSLVQMLIESGAIGPEQAASVPQNVIMQALGTTPSVQVAMTAVELCKDDRLIVCSDGLSNKLSAEEMSGILRNEENLTNACRRMIEVANDRGGEDNITVIIARFDGEALDSAEARSITGTFQVLDQGCPAQDNPVFIKHLKGLQTSPEPTGELKTLVINAVSPIETPLPEAGSVEPDGDLSAKTGSSVRWANRRLIIAGFIVVILLALLGYLIHLFLAG
jgi:serine/threonine protein phosphatase PrpC